MTIELDQFHEVFFEESLEGIEIMEQALLNMDESTGDPEAVNSIFRAAHSIKGGSGTFGFIEVTRFTHVMETLLDEVREGNRSLTNESIELLLKSCDCLRDMIEILQSGESVDPNSAQHLLSAFEEMLREDSASEPQGESDSERNADVALQSQQSGSATTGGYWQIEFIPEPQILQTGNEPLRIFRELAGLGKLTALADTSGIPPFDQLTANECHLKWKLNLEGEIEQAQIEEAFDWVVDECELNITYIQGAEENPEDIDSASTDEVTTEPNNPERDEAPVPVESTKQGSSVQAKKNSSSSIRVGIDKVDSLINLVGELVITQSMLSELGREFDISKVDLLAEGLEQLLQNTKELQESAMSIRMLPISFAFNRFPRMIRDLAVQMDKKVEMQVNGEHTELDKTVIEQIGDPLIHLVRNAIDHGIETAATRAEAGKPEEGKIVLNAYHQGGNIVIEVSDDGKGIDRDVILQKAIEKGVVDAASGTDLSDSQVYDFLFAPGFSTAAVVSDISGRGVGMDVVKRNIRALGGRIQIESELGVGSTFRIHLPLTMAILDGQLVRVGKEIFIIPLITIVESLQIKPELVNRVAGGIVLYRLREDNVPITPIFQQCGVEADNVDLDDALLVVVEADGQKIGLLVDDLLAQQQVVIKSLQDNYQQVPGISGATILGDGSVAMILDIAGLIDGTLGRPLNQQSQAA